MLVSAFHQVFRILHRLIKSRNRNQMTTFIIEYLNTKQNQIKKSLIIGITAVNKRWSTLPPFLCQLLEVNINTSYIYKDFVKDIITSQQSCI